MFSNLFSSTLFVCVAMISVATGLLAVQARKHYRAHQIELAVRMPGANNACNEITDVSECSHTYSTNYNDWTDCGNSSEASFSAPHAGSPSSMSHRSCPRCGSNYVERRNQARKAGSAIGAVAGATSGVAMTLSGAEVGATVRLMAGPIGSVFGGLAGAILAGLAASAAGCAAGAAVGEVIDKNVLDNHRCSACGHTFNASV